MPVLTCPVRAPCVPCPDDTPVLNLSAEAGDFGGFNGYNDFPNDPVLGDTFSSQGCVQICFAATQAEADACAAAQAQECAQQDNGPNVPGCPSPGGCSNDGGEEDDNDGGGPPGGPFRNVQHTRGCGGGGDVQNNGAVFPAGLSLGGTPVSVIVAAGLFSGQTQVEADTNALTYLNNFFDAAINDGTLSCGTLWTYSGRISTPANLNAPVISDGSNLPATHSDGALELHMDMDPLENVHACGGPPFFDGQKDTDVTAVRLLGPYAQDAIISVNISSLVDRHPLAPCGGAPTPGIGAVHVCVTTTDTYQCGCTEINPPPGSIFFECDDGSPCPPDTACPPGPTFGLNCHDATCYVGLTSYTGDFRCEASIANGLTSNSCSQIIGGTLPAGKIASVRCHIRQLGVGLVGLTDKPQAKVDFAITVTLI